MQLHDIAEKIGFLSICNRQNERMSNLKIYERRRRNTLKTAAKALNQKIKATDVNETKRYVNRVRNLTSHIVLLDEIWVLLNPTRQFFYGYLVHNEFVTAARHVREGSFDDYYNNYSVSTSLKS